MIKDCVLKSPKQPNVISLHNLAKIWRTRWRINWTEQAFFLWKSYEVPLMKGMIVRGFTFYLSSHFWRFLNQQYKARASLSINLDHKRSIQYPKSWQSEGTGVLLCAIWLKHEFFLPTIFGCRMFQTSANSFFWNNPASKKMFHSCCLILILIFAMLYFTLEYMWSDTLQKWWHMYPGVWE